MGARRALTVDFVQASSLWDAQPAAQAVVRQAINAAADLAKDRTPGRAELAFVLGDDAGIRQLNRQWRNRDSATNVLSFPSNAKGPKNAHLGDVVIAFETVQREAAAENKPFDHHLAHLAIHGFLHLLGYDHDDDDSASNMEATERQALEMLGIADPYRGEA